MTTKLTNEERETLANSLRWHFACHAEEPTASYASLGVDNAVLIVERIIADRVQAIAAERDTALSMLSAGNVRWSAIEVERDALRAAVDRVRRRHPRGDEESTFLAPGLWCPTCGHQRTDNGYGGCPDRQALIIPWQPLRALTTPADQSAACICDGAAYHTAEQNVRRHPFLVHPDCPVHADQSDTAAGGGDRG